MTRAARLALLLAPLAVAGCSDGSSSAAAPGPLVRAFGRGGEPLRYDAPPSRILPTNAAALDFVAALVGPERVVALPETAATYSIVPVGEAPWRDKPTLVDYTAEKVLALDPGLVVAHAWQDANATAILRRAGVGVVELPDVTEFEHLALVLRALGDLLHAEERAEEEIAALEARREALVAGRPARARSALFYSNFGAGGGWTAGAGTVEALILRLAGLDNAAADAGIEGHPQVDLEQLLSLAPDLLIVPASGEDSEFSATRAFLDGEPLAQELEAVRAGRLIVLPVRLYSTASQQILDAAEAIQRGARALD
jgi:iron complex transport system substrate-binding protein